MRLPLRPATRVLIWVSLVVPSASPAALAQKGLPDVAGPGAGPGAGSGEQAGRSPKKGVVPSPVAMAEERARELAVLAKRLEALAAETAAAAEDARRRADAARAEADRLRRVLGPPDPAPGPGGPTRPYPGANGTPDSGSAPPRLGPGRPGGGGRSASGNGAPRRAGPEPIVARVARTETSPFGGPTADMIHASLEHTTAANKARFLGAKRARRSGGVGRRRIEESLTYSPEEAPDLADVDLLATWQWGINIARGRGNFAGAAPGSIPRTGSIDYARLTVGPKKGAFAERKMKWGIRRYNLGDTTVVDCDFTGIPEEHGLYDALCGHALYLGNTFQGLGGQAIQIAHRDRPFQQYKADNLAWAAPPLIVVDDCHAVDCGRFAARSGFTWSFFDPGTLEHPGTVIVRGCTSVHEWDFARTTGGRRTALDAPDGVRSPGGLVVQHYRGLPKDAPVGAATRAVVIDRCLFDHSKSAMPLVAIRGVGTVLIEDSCFIARDGKLPYVDIDDLPGQPSGRVILQNCVTTDEGPVLLRIGREVIRSVHCPDQRVVIDVPTRQVVVGDVVEEPLSRVLHPLEPPILTPGVHPQPKGHVDAIGPIALPPLGE
ncbi:MAG: hypothetical protein AAFU73_14335 [Planctomycetota bacterium]